MLPFSQLTVFFFIGLFCAIYPGSGDLIPDTIPINDLMKDLSTNSDEDRCFQDMRYAFQDPRANDQLGLRMMDAFGKPESGILEWNFKWVGSYHECINIYAPPNENYTAENYTAENSTAGDFNGQYCKLSLSAVVFNMTVPLVLGVCLPDSCGPVPVEKFNVPHMGYDVNITEKICQLTSRKLTTPAIAMICVLSFFIILAFVGSSITVYEYIANMSFQDNRVQYNEQINEGDAEKQIQDSSIAGATFKPNQRDNNGWQGTAREFFSCFCIFTNGEKILNTDSTEGQMLCLHGIRFISMTWVIVCHEYSLPMKNLGNIKATVPAVNTFPFQIIMNGFYSVDSFFLLSGFLLAYLYFQECAKKGKISWTYFYIHRYLRLTPVYAMVLGWLTALQYYVGSGPFWQVNELEQICNKNWFYNMLYINNFADPAKNCMAWTWYLCNDMQFFIVSPILLITLYRWPKIGYSVLGLFMSVTVAANLGLTYHYNLLSGFGHMSTDPSVITSVHTTMDDLNRFYKYIYEKPYTRMSPYLLGIALAYFLFKRKQSNAGKLNLITLVCGWIVSAALSLTCLFCLYDRKLSVHESAFYNAFSHVCFTGGLSWVIFTCLNKQAGPVDKILSFKLFIPLSRLTYCAYLIHPLIYMGYWDAMKTTFDFSHMAMVSLFLGLLVVTYAIAFIVSVLLESPIIRIEKLVRTKLMSKR